MSTGYVGKGAKLTFGTGTTGIGQVLSITGPDSSRGQTDITNIDSGWKEYLPVTPDAGELSLEVLYDGTANATLLAGKLTTAATAETITLTFPDSGTWACTGFLTRLGHAIPSVDDKVTQSVSIKFTGEPTASY